MAKPERRRTLSWLTGFSSYLPESGIAEVAQIARAPKAGIAEVTQTTTVPKASIAEVG